MTTEIFLLNIQEQLNNPVNKYLDYFSEERQRKILSYKFLPDRNRTVFAELLARNLIAEKSGKNFSQIKILRDSNGRPYYENNSIKLNFSLSHSGKWVACSIGEVINGIDVECYERKIDIKIAEHFFLPQEFKNLKFLSENNLNWKKKFFQYWTLKESCLKCLNLKEWSKVDCEKLLSGNFNFNLKGKNFDLPDGSILGICTLQEFIPEKINFLVPSDLNL